MTDSISDADSNSLHHRTFDPTDSEQPTNAVVMTLADAEDVSPLELESLHHSINTAALNSLFGHDVRSSFTIEFTALGWEVSISSEGEVTVFDSDR